MFRSTFLVSVGDLRGAKGGVQCPWAAVAKGAPSYLY